MDGGEDIGTSSQSGFDIRSGQVLHAGSLAFQSHKLSREEMNTSEVEGELLEEGAKLVVGDQFARKSLTASILHCSLINASLFFADVQRYYCRMIFFSCSKVRRNCRRMKCRVSTRRGKERKKGATRSS